MEFKDKAVDNHYSDLRMREDELYLELQDVQEEIAHLIANNEQE